MAYSIALLLEGKYYRSRSTARRVQDGIIQYAEKRSDIHDLYEQTAWACRVRPTYKGHGEIKPDFWATVYVNDES